MARSRYIENGLATRFWRWQELVKVVIFGMNGVAVAQNGLKLWVNEALGSGKAMRCLPDLWEAIKNT